MPRTWHQAHVVIDPWADAEHVAAAALGPLMADAQNAGLISAWFFIRKNPTWRLRYRPADGTEHRAIDQVGSRLDHLRDDGVIAAWTGPIYEPEARAFGGDQAMYIAHDLFHADSHHLLIRLAKPEAADAAVRRTLSVLLCATLLRGAGLDWYEQGDVWARVAEHRPLPADAESDKLHTVQSDLHKLLIVDSARLIRSKDDLAFATEWSKAFATAGTALAELNSAGRLHRGLREVASHHIIFTWNRHGIPASTQAVLAHSAARAVFGSEPAAWQGAPG
jgi:thiopeptide-type bacteriocin biosynthesis protein